MSSMKLDSQAGFVSGILIALIVTSVLLVSALGFGTWAFLSRQDYKNNSDQKALKAADERQAQTEEAEALKYAEEVKNPLTTHKAPDQYGGVIAQYPKTWSAYVIESAAGNTPVDNYFHPHAVPSTANKDNAYALRIEVVEQSYDKVIKSYDNEVKTKKLTASPFALAKVPATIGTRFDGQVLQNKQGSLVVLPLRNMTVKIWTEAPSFLADFNNIILPNLTFSP
jgi:hypothetical protein